MATLSEWASSFWRWLYAIQPVVWGALTGATLTLIGVAAQNYFEFKRLRLQLAHDAEQRNRNRLLDLRRTVFLEATESVTKGMRLIASAGDLDKPFAPADPADFAGLAKAHLVAGLDTIKAIDNVSVVLGEQVLALYDIRLRAELAQHEMDLASDELKRLQSFGEHLVTLVNAGRNEMGFRPGQDPTAQQLSAAEHLSGLSGQEEAIVTRRAQAEQTLDLARRALLVKIVEASMQVGTAMSAAVVAVRLELEQSSEFDRTGYQRHVSESQARQNASYRDFVARWTEDDE